MVVLASTEAVTCSSVGRIGWRLYMYIYTNEEPRTHKLSRTSLALLELWRIQGSGYSIYYQLTSRCEKVQICLDATYSVDSNIFPAWFLTSSCFQKLRDGNKSTPQLNSLDGPLSPLLTQLVTNHSSCLRYGWAMVLSESIPFKSFVLVGTTG